MDNYMGPFVAISVKKGILECSILSSCFACKYTHYFLTLAQDPDVFFLLTAAARPRTANERTAVRCSAGKGEKASIR